MSSRDKSSPVPGHGAARSKSRKSQLDPEGAGRDEPDRAAPCGDSVRAARDAKKHAKQLAKKKTSLTSDMPRVRLTDDVAPSSTAADPPATCRLAALAPALAPAAAAPGTIPAPVVAAQAAPAPAGSASAAHMQAATPTSTLSSITSTEGKNKAQLRAERRAVQEAQRAAKTALVPPPPCDNTATKEVKVTSKASDKTNVRPKREDMKTTRHRVTWFQHLHRDRTLHTPLNNRDLHPAVVRLATQLEAHVVVGANARCVALLHALQQVVADYTLPARTEFSRGLESALATSLALVWSARPPTPSMTNAVKHVRSHLTQLPNNITEFHAKCKIKEAIDTYIREQVEMAGDAISLAVRAKISPGDHILTYGCSSLVEKILKEAWSGGAKFRAVVVGRRARPEARELLRRLVAHGVPSVYVDIAAVSFIMRTVDKVVLGAGALLANGWVLARAGTAQVALVARAHNVPVLVACETHKFSERVQTDAFVYNELGEEDTLVESAACPLRAWRSLDTLTPLEITYDVTPPDLVTAVVTELAVLPCTSAPVVLRFKLSEYAV